METGFKLKYRRVRLVNLNDVASLFSQSNWPRYVLFRASIRYHKGDVTMYKLCLPILNLSILNLFQTPRTNFLWWILTFCKGNFVKTVSNNSLRTREGIRPNLRLLYFIPIYEEDETSKKIVILKIYFYFRINPTARKVLHEEKEYFVLLKLFLNLNIREYWNFENIGNISKSFAISGEDEKITIF